jgi:hypothetical protein
MLPHPTRYCLRRYHLELQWPLSLQELVELLAVVHQLQAVAAAQTPVAQPLVDQQLR